MVGQEFPNNSESDETDGFSEQESIKDDPTTPTMVHFISSDLLLLDKSASLLDVLPSVTTNERGELPLSSCKDDLPTLLVFFSCLEDTEVEQRGILSIVVLVVENRSVDAAELCLFSEICSKSALSV